MTSYKTDPIIPLDPMDVSKLKFLYNLQGNILKGHGRDHTTHIFIRFKEGQDKLTAQKWLKGFAENYVTCFQQQLKERELYNRNKTPGSLFASVFLSKKGYEYLGFTNVQYKLKDLGFKSGMQERIAVNNDPPVSHWEKGFGEEIHAMILLADDNLKRMGEKATELIKDKLETISHICTIEYGHVIRNANGDGIEHFGYVDGVSQPLFLKDEVDDYMKFHNIQPDGGQTVTGNKLKFDPRAPASLVLIPDPYVTKSSNNEPDSWGSYFVFRKLEQDVKGFKNAEGKIGADLFPGETDEEKKKAGCLGKEFFHDETLEEKREIVGAYLVGRSEDGTPIEISDTEGLIGSGKFNNFNYDDPSDGRCPHFAHIRKTNPRKDIGGVDHKGRIMARRGIPYGHRAIDTALGIDPSSHQMPEEGVGLLFMSYQASIEKQFESIQSDWANNVNSPQSNTGIDPIIGQSKDDKRQGSADQEDSSSNGTSGNLMDGKHRSYAFPKEYNNPSAKTIDGQFNQFVHMKGGEYFFAPSIPFLKNIEKILSQQSNETFSDHIL